MKKELSIQFATLQTILLYAFLEQLNLVCMWYIIDDSNIRNRDDLVRLMGIIPLVNYVITYTLAYLSLKRQNESPKLLQNYDKESNKKIILAIVIIAIGLFIFRRPFFDWQILSNVYFNTIFEVIDYSNYEFSSNKIYRIISAVLIAPICEEFFFRYHIFAGLLKKYNFYTALFVSSAIFSLIHIDSPRNLLPTFIFGIFSAIIFFRTKNIYYSILLHFLTNLTWAILLIFTKEYYFFKLFLGTGFFYWIVVLFGLGISVVMLKNLPKIDENLKK
jgi:membrane protease YdiL (CAAX protease family)